MPMIWIFFFSDGSEDDGSRDVYFFSFYNGGGLY